MEGMLKIILIAKVVIDTLIALLMSVLFGLFVLASEEQLPMLSAKFRAPDIYT